jgi:hypothetical protein
MRIIPESIQAKVILPNTVGLVGVINTNIVENMKKQAPIDLDLPTMWSLAKLIVTEKAPLNVFQFRTEDK